MAYSNEVYYDFMLESLEIEHELKGRFLSINAYSILENADQNLLEESAKQAIGDALKKISDAVENAVKKVIRYIEKLVNENKIIIKGVVSKANKLKDKKVNIVGTAITGEQVLPKINKAYLGVIDDTNKRVDETPDNELDSILNNLSEGEWGVWETKVIDEAFLRKNKITNYQDIYPCIEFLDDFSGGKYKTFIDGMNKCADNFKKSVEFVKKNTSTDGSDTQRLKIKATMLMKFCTIMSTLISKYVKISLKACRSFIKYSGDKEVTIENTLEDICVQDKNGAFYFFEDVDMIDEYVDDLDEIGEGYSFIDVFKEESVSGSSQKNNEKLGLIEKINKKLSTSKYAIPENEFKSYLPQVADYLKKNTDKNFTINMSKEEKTNIDRIFLKTNKAAKGNVNNGAERKIVKSKGVTFIYYVATDGNAPYGLYYLYTGENGQTFFNYAHSIYKNIIKKKGIK